MSQKLTESSGSPAVQEKGPAYGQRKLQGLRRLTAMFRGILKRWGPSPIKRMAWDIEYSTGSWDHRGDYACPDLSEIILRYLNEGNILDLGCGDGVIGQNLPPALYNHYTGVDISEVAIQKAIQRCGELSPEKIEKDHYVACDIVSYTPRESQHVILFRFSINYVPKLMIPSVLERYQKHLDQDGVIILIQNDPGRHAYIREIVRSGFEILEEQSLAGTLTLVFR